MKKIILKIAVVGTLFVSIAACSPKISGSNNGTSSNQQTRQARGERPQFSDLLLKMDDNKDGKLSKSEIDGPLQNNFSEIDKDKDGFIPEAEFNDTPPPPRGRRN